MHKTWTKSQKKHAKELYDRALERKYAALMDEIRRWEIETPDDIWRLRERLNAKAREVDEKYEYRYSRLIFLFARLVHEGYLREEEFAVLGEEISGRILSLTRG